VRHILIVAVLATIIAAPAFAGLDDDPFEDKATAQEQQLITFRANNLSLMEALQIVAEMADLKVRISGNVVMLVPKNKPDSKIVHKMFRVEPNFSQKVAQASGLR
jgi:hypothetical protein